MPAAARELRQHVCGVRDEGHRFADPLGAPAVDRFDRLVEGVGQLVDITGIEAPASTRLVHLDDQRRPTVHRDRQGLGTAHAAQTRGDRRRPGEAAAKVLARGLGEGLVRALDDPLGGDVDPRAGSHLSVHRQAGPLELAELLPGGPMRHEVRIRDQDPRAVARRAEHADRLAGLDQECLVVLEPLQLGDDRVEGLPAPCRPTGAAVDDEVVGILGHVRVEVVHQHAQGGFLLPPLAGELGAARRADRARTTAGLDGRHAPMIRPGLSGSACRPRSSRSFRSRARDRPRWCRAPPTRRPSQRWAMRRWRTRSTSPAMSHHRMRTTR